MQTVRLRSLLLTTVAITIVIFSVITWQRALVAVDLQSRAQASERVLAQALLAQSSTERAGTELVAAARVLAERPTLGRLIGERDSLALAAFLDRYATTGKLRGGAVLTGARVWARGGFAQRDELPSDSAVWPLGIWSLAGATEEGRPQLAVRVPVPSHPGFDVLILDELQALVTHEGNSHASAVQLGLVGVDVVRSAFDDPRSLLWSRALSADSTQVERIRGEAMDSYCAAAAVRDGSGQTVAVVSVTLPAALVDAPRRDIAKALLRDFALLGLVGGAVFWAVSRRLSRGLERLTSASMRIRDGDLETPVAASAATFETAQLSQAMEQMRERTRALTIQLDRARVESEAILDGIADGVFSVDRERRIQYLSPQAVSMLGASPGESEGRFCGDVLDPAPIEGQRPCDTYCPILQARSTGSSRCVETLRLRDGSTRTMILSSYADLRSASDAPDGVANAWRQVQVLRAESDQEAVQRLRNSVVANVSHEFRTPLSAQLASMEMLWDRIDPQEKLKLEPLLASIHRGNLRLSRLVDNLLESLSIDAGQTALRRQRIELRAVCEEAIDATLPLIQQKQQSVRLEFGTDLPPIVGDRTRLVQVFVNLLANANKFAPAGSTIRVGARCAERGVEAWVEDEGPGLPEGEEDRLFDRFVRAAAEQPGESGLGLGLWLVRSIVERHGGQVLALRRNRGTRFLLQLPASSQSDEDPSR